MAYGIAETTTDVRTAEDAIIVEQAKPKSLAPPTKAAGLADRKRRMRSRNIHAISVSFLALAVLLLTLRGAIEAKRARDVAGVSDDQKAPTGALPKETPDEKKKEKKEDKKVTPKGKDGETVAEEEKKVEKPSAEGIDLSYDFPKIKDEKVKAHLREVLQYIADCTKEHSGYREQDFVFKDRNATICVKVLESKRRSYWPFVGPVNTTAVQLERAIQLVSERTNNKKADALQTFTINEQMPGSNGYVSFGIAGRWDPDEEGAS